MLSEDDLKEIALVLQRFRDLSLGLQSLVGPSSISAAKDATKLAEWADQVRDKVIMELGSRNEPRNKHGETEAEHRIRVANQAKISVDHNGVPIHNEDIQRFVDALSRDNNANLTVEGTVFACKCAYDTAIGVLPLKPLTTKFQAGESVTVQTAR